MNTDNPSGQALPAGTRLGEFTIERVLGSGGFGITYLAQDTSLGRRVVIKENLPAQFCFRDPGSLTVAPRHTHGEDAESFEWSLRNFSREASTLASLDHPGIVRVLRSFEAFGTAYFVMPFVEGRSLDGMIEKRWSDGDTFSEEELRGFLRYSLDALDHLHAKEIFHRDIKPANLLITSEGVPVLIDFGSARQRLGDRSLTIIESAGYTPFEQLQSHGDIGPWTDLYALGATLVRAITNAALPKAADRVINDPWKGLSDDPGWLQSYSPGFLRAIDKAVAVTPTSRWQTGRDWLQGMDGSGPALAKAQPPAQPKAASSKFIFGPATSGPTAAGHAPSAGAVTSRNVLRPTLATARAGHPVMTALPNSLPRKSGKGRMIVLSALAVSAGVGTWAVRSSRPPDNAKPDSTTQQARPSSLVGQTTVTGDTQKAAELAVKRPATSAMAETPQGSGDRRLTETRAERLRHAAEEMPQTAEREAANRAKANIETPAPPSTEAPADAPNLLDEGMRTSLAVLARGTLEEAKECVRRLELLEQKFPNAREVSKTKAIVMEVFRAEATLRAAIQAMPKAEKAAETQIRNAEIAERPSPLTGRVDWDGSVRSRNEAARIIQEAQGNIAASKARLADGLREAGNVTKGSWGSSVTEVWSLVAKRNLIN